MKNCQLRIIFGGEHSRADFEAAEFRVTLAAPVLGKQRQFSLALPEGKTQPNDPDCTVFDSGDLVTGFLRGTPGKGLETSTGELYERMLRVVGDRFLYRIWHFVPNINAWETGLENYRLFCQGRAEAFNRILGDDCHERLSAASAVGSSEKEPVILFVAGRTQPRHAENPEQVPAYCYPPIYGPRSPSFARASRVAVAGGEVVFVSGTASIKGSETIHPDQCEEQVKVTLHNLALIGESSGLGPDLGRASGGSRRFVVYLRHPEDLPRTEAILQQQLFAPGDEIIFLLADICRADLMVEIEATIFIPTREF